MKKLLMITALAVAPAAFAEMNYDYVDVNYSRIEDDFGNSTNDPSLFLSKSLADQVQFRFGYGKLDTTDVIKFGLGYNTDLSESTDFVFTVDAVRLSDTFGEFAMFEIGLGARSAVAESVELEGTLIYSIGLFGADPLSDIFGAQIGGRYNVTDTVSLGLSYRTLDDLDYLTATFRFGF